MELNSRDANEVNLLLDKSNFSRLRKDEIPGGRSTNLLLATLSDLRATRSAKSSGKFFNLLKERSSSSSFLR